MHASSWYSPPPNSQDKMLTPLRREAREIVRSDRCEERPVKVARRRDTVACCCMCVRAFRAHRSDCGVMRVRKRTKCVFLYDSTVCHLATGDLSFCRFHSFNYGVIRCGQYVMQIQQHIKSIIYYLFVNCDNHTNAFLSTTPHRRTY